MNLKNEKGSITMFVLVGLLFMTGFLMISIGSNINRSKISKEQFNIISSIYSYGDGSENAYNRAYAKLRKKSKNLTAFVENEKILTLSGTYARKLDNYRIYGNTSGTQSVGNTTNLFDTKTALNNLNNKFSVSQDEGYDVIQSKKGYWDGRSLFSSNITTLKPGTYTLSCELKDNSGVSQIYYGFYSASSVKYQKYINPEKGKWISSAYTFTLTAETEISGWQFQGDRNSTTGDYSNLDIQVRKIQLEVGSSASDYSPYGEYNIPVKFTDGNGKTETFNICLSGPLKKSGEAVDYIDYKSQKVIWQVDSQEEESITLPDILTYEDNTNIEILTEVKPSKIEVDYVGYSIE